MEPPSPQCSSAIQTCTAQSDCPKQFQCDPLPASAQQQIPPQFQQQLVCAQQQCTCQPSLNPPSFGFRQPCQGKGAANCCPDNLAPAQCPPQLAQACKTVQCDNGITVSSCNADGCNKCVLVVKGKNGAAVTPGACRIPFNESSVCPGVVCPPATGAPNCGTRPTACPSDWKLRCIRDPCVCTRSIWVDEDLRVPDSACSAAIQPPCATTCPSKFSCPGLPSPLKCMQQKCTCQTVVDPSSMPPGMGAQGQGGQGQGPPGQMGPQGQMGGPPGQMGGPPGQMGGPPGQMGGQMGGPPGQMGQGQMGQGQMGQPGQMGPQSGQGGPNFAGRRR